MYSNTNDSANVFPKPIQVLVRSDNVAVPDRLKGTQVLTLDALSPAAIRQAIADRYGFQPEAVARFELWTNPLGRSRTNLDEMSDLTLLGHNTVYFRARVVPRMRQDTSYGDIDAAISP
jgi:hypothetical protein